MIARYTHYDTVWAHAEGIIAEPFGLFVFLNRDCEVEVLMDSVVTNWVAAQGHEIVTDEGIWDNPAVRGEPGACGDYPHAVVIDQFDSAVIIFRDHTLATAFKLEFC